MPASNGSWATVVRSAMELAVDAITIAIALRRPAGLVVP